MARKLEGRKQTSMTMRQDTSKMLNAYSQRTMVPMSRLLDVIVAAFMKDQPEIKLMDKVAE